MGTHRIDDKVEDRLYLWIISKSGGQENAKKYFGLTFSECVDALLREAGF